MSFRKGLGQYLQERGVLTKEALKKALAEQEHSGHPLRAILLREGIVGETEILDYFEQELGFPRLDIENFPLDPETAALVPEDVARRHQLIPAFHLEDVLTIVMVDPLNLVAQDEIKRLTGLSLEVGVASTEIVTAAIDKLYTGRVRARSPERSNISLAGSSDAETTGEGPIITLVNKILLQAFREGASDVHIEPEEKELRVRFRVDGVLHEAARHPLSVQGAIAARIKVMAELDLAEKRRPQDGRARFTNSGVDLDLRVSTFPTLYGENTVLRLLDRSSGLSTLKSLGFEAETQGRIVELIEKPHGLFLVTGPTGSGKTTTLYACLDHLNTPERNIATLEDPVEYRLASVRQTQVDPDCDLTFARGLRALLRQDPDIIMVGEIRDGETAEIAVRSSLTGHFVLSTLHTNDALGALVRLMDMGSEPFLVAQSTVGILAQRLVRAVCTRCRKPSEPPAEVLRRLGIAPGSREFFTGKGCNECRGSGYRGRAGIYELLTVTDPIRDAVCSGAKGSEVEMLARAAGFRRLRDDAMDKAARGITTLEEVLRVTSSAGESESGSMAVAA